MNIYLLITLLLLATVCGYVTRYIFVKFRLSHEEERLKKIKDAAKKEAEEEKKSILLNAKDQILKDRNDFERETKERRIELQQLEKRLVAKDENLERKIDNLDKKEITVVNREKQAQKLEDEHKKKQEELIRELEKLSGMSVQEAKEMLIASLEEAAKSAASKRINRIEEETKQVADKKARYIIATSAQRLASEVTQEITVSSVTLPNDEMKGRIIGREGRNIRTLETLTGVDVIIDDTPEAVVISCFDPVRREIARITLERLILDGRIHPTRIEELVLKVKKEIDGIIMEEGEKARLQLNLTMMKPEIIKNIGRLKYRTSYGQNVLSHILEVSNLSGMIAGELGANVDTAIRAGFLHDVGKAIQIDGQGGHAETGADFLKRMGEHPKIIDIVREHHSDNTVTNINTLIIQSADAISASRTGARRESFENYVKRLTDLENLANSFQGVEKSFAIQAGREIRVLVNNDSIDDEKSKQLARDIAKQIEDKLMYPGQIKVAVIRETRAIEYAH